MDHFSYKEGILHAEEVSIQEIAKEVGTPFYIYSTATLRRHFDLFESALSGVDHLICYAVKVGISTAVLYGVPSSFSSTGTVAAFSPMGQASRPPHKKSRAKFSLGRDAGGGVNSNLTHQS